MKLKTIWQRLIILAASIVIIGLALPSKTSAQQLSAKQSAAASLEYLRRVMDQYHNRFPVYDDVSSPGNHFFAWAQIPDKNSYTRINGSWTDHPHSGATAIRCEFDSTTGTNFGGFYFQNGILLPTETKPRFNFGKTPDAGINLSGATTLTIWARGERGGEVVEFLMGGVGLNPQTGKQENKYPDSTPAVSRKVILTKQWTPYPIELKGKNLSYVLGGFGWVVSALENPQGAIFYLDDIQYELSRERLAKRLNEQRLLRSFTTEPFQSAPSPVGIFDLAMRNSAEVYDNSLALLAFLADGSDDSVRRAALIGDAFVYASQHDRTLNDVQLRNSYSAGDIALAPGWIPNGRAATAAIPGFYDEAKQQFFEIRQESIDTGDNAWAMVSLLALYQRTPKPAYLETALKLGEFINRFRAAAGRYKGYQGGVESPDSNEPKRRAYASTEHNLDIYAAFTMMFKLTGDRLWQERAQHAKEFVDAMWDASKGCYLTGTTSASERNTNSQQLPLDAQAWSVLSLRDTPGLHAKALQCAENNHRANSEGFSGFDFNNDKDGVWFEGTGQMAVAYAVMGQPAQAERLRQELRRAQQTAPFGDRYGLAAATRDGLSTGFGFMYFRRLHVGATAWNVFAQLQVNPYYLTAASTPPSNSHHVERRELPGRD
jgi:hypothetical protein